jgi:hypothetical protein
VQPTTSELGASDQTNASCDVCPHPWDDHDAIAKRFCAAMAASGHLRGCVCSGAAGGMTYSNSTKGPIST